MGKPYRAIKAMFPRNRWRIVEGDEVVVRGTQFSGQIGKVLAVLRDPRVPQVVVEGVNLRKKKVTIGDSLDDTMVVTMEHPIHYSNVNLIEPAASTSVSLPSEVSQEARGSWPGVRAKFRYDQNGERVRIGKGRYAAGRIIPWPTRMEEKPIEGGIKDTDAAEAARMTRAEDDFNVLLSGASSRDGSSTVASSTARGHTSQTASLAGAGGRKPLPQPSTMGAPPFPPQNTSYSTLSSMSHSIASPTSTSTQAEQLQLPELHKLRVMAEGVLTSASLLPPCMWTSFAARGLESMTALSNRRADVSRTRTVGHLVPLHPLVDAVVGCVLKTRAS